MESRKVRDHLNCKILPCGMIKVECYIKSIHPNFSSVKQHFTARNWDTRYGTGMGWLR